jgi:hypothetical protein
MTYENAVARAQALADETGCDHGVRRSIVYDGGYSPPFRLPGARDRYGIDIDCEVIRCANPVTMRPGHGRASQPEASL